MSFVSMSWTAARREAGAGGYRVSPPVPCECEEGATRDWREGPHGNTGTRAAMCRGYSNNRHDMIEVSFPWHWRWSRLTKQDSPMHWIATLGGGEAAKMKHAKDERGAWRGRRDAVAVSSTPESYRELCHTLAISTITAFSRLTPSHVIHAHTHTRTHAHTHTRTHAHTHISPPHSRAAHHVPACNHRAIHPVGRLWCAGQSVLRHNLPGCRLASCRPCLLL
jgi:hypothetical protein